MKGRGRRGAVVVRPPRNKQKKETGRRNRRERRRWKWHLLSGFGSELTTVPDLVS